MNKPQSSYASFPLSLSSWQKEWSGACSSVTHLLHRPRTLSSEEFDCNDTKLLSGLVTLDQLNMSSDSANGLAAVSGAMMGLSIIAVGMRFNARKQQKARYMADDWMVLPALVSAA